MVPCVDVRTTAATTFVTKFLNVCKFAADTFPIKAYLRYVSVRQYFVSFSQTDL